MSFCEMTITVKIGDGASSTTLKASFQAYNLEQLQKSNDRLISLVKHLWPEKSNGKIKIIPPSPHEETIDL